MRSAVLFGSRPRRILLSEIVTFGAKPYPGIANSELFALLEQGYRMPHSNLAYASTTLYSIMCSCWDEVPEERPRFDSLVSMLLSVPDMEYIVEMNQSEARNAETADVGPGYKKLGANWHVPYAPSQLFTGRADELAELHQKLLNPRPVRTTTHAQGCAEPCRGPLPHASHALLCRAKFRPRSTYSQTSIACPCSEPNTRQPMAPAAPPALHGS